MQCRKGFEAFSLQGLNKANSIFDLRKGDPKFFTDPKAISINAHYLRNLPIEEIEPYVRAELEKAGIWNPEFAGAKRDHFLETVDLIRSRFNFTTDFWTLGRAYFTDDYPMDPKALKKNILKHEGLKEWFSILSDRLDAVEGFTADRAEKVIREMAAELEIKAGILINGIRTAVTGQAAGPGLFDVLIVLGKDRVVKRLKKARSFFD